MTVSRTLGGRTLGDRTLGRRAPGPRTPGRSRRPAVVLAALAAVLAIGTTVLVAGGTPAAAAPDPGTPTVMPRPSLPDGCPADSLCLHLHRDLLGGHIFVIPAGASVPNLHLFACEECDSPRHSAGDGNFGDQMSSYVNNTSLTYCWWYDIDYRGAGGTILPHQTALWVGKLQDELSSTMPC